MSGYRRREREGRHHQRDYQDRSRSQSRDSGQYHRGGRGGGRGRGRGRGGGPRAANERDEKRQETKEKIARMHYQGEDQLLSYKAEVAHAHDKLKIKADIVRDTANHEERREKQEIRERSKELEDLPIAKMNGSLSEGRKIPLKTNAYRIEINPSSRFYVYELLSCTVKASKGRPPELKKKERRTVIGKLGRMLGAPIAFDGESCLLLYKEFRGIGLFRCEDVGWVQEDARNNEFEFGLADVPRENGKKDHVEGRLTFRLEVSLSTVSDYINGLNDGVPPSDVIQAVEIVMRTLPAARAQYLSKGRAAFCDIVNTDSDKRNIPGGKTVWHGICQSAKISHWKSIGKNALTLNLDLAHALMFRQSLMTDLYEEYEGRHHQLEESLKHLDIEVIGGDRQYYKFSKFSRYPIAHTEMYDSRTEAVHNMFDFFRRAGYNHLNGQYLVVETTAKHKKAPKGNQVVKFPLENVRLLGGQRPKGLISEKTQADFIRATAEPAPDRQAKIQEIVENKELFDRQVLETYGLRLSKSAMDAEGHVLVTPKIFANQGEEIDVKPNDENSWNISQFEQPAAPVNRNWMRVVIGENQNEFGRYWNEAGQHLCKIGTELGVPMGAPLFSEWFETGLDFDGWCARMKKADPKAWANLAFILVCCGRNKDDYSLVKVAAELNHSVMTQCILPKTVMENNRISLRNIWYKINKKLGGHNWKIQIPLPESPVPLMVMGYGLSHAEKDSADPTIAGFVASTAQGALGYKNYVDVQHPGLNIVAKRVLKDAMAALLSKYRDENNNALPERIIIYRGGGSEGAFQAILKNELMGIREALTELKADYQPGITFICAIRSSHQKFFAADKKDETGMGRNVPIGTCVSGFGNGTPDSYSFHLMSHSAIGCANPTFYSVLHDDNGIELQNMVNMTYALSMATQRCNKSTSHTTPVFLSNLLTERARNHWKGTALGHELRANGFRRIDGDHKLRVQVLERFQNEVFFI